MVYDSGPTWASHVEWHHLDPATPECQQWRLFVTGGTAHAAAGDDAGSGDGDALSDQNGAHDEDLGYMPPVDEDTAGMAAATEEPAPEHAATEELAPEQAPAAAAQAPEGRRLRKRSRRR